jgi:hypothetical protein
VIISTPLRRIALEHSDRTDLLRELVCQYHSRNSCSQALAEHYESISLSPTRRHLASLLSPTPKRSEGGGLSRDDPRIHSILVRTCGVPHMPCSLRLFIPNRRPWLLASLLCAISTLYTVLCTFWLFKVTSGPRTSLQAKLCFLCHFFDLLDYT